ncbi:Hypothetical protein GbCGDNIH2_1308 [Granulibacter bethesdensis]|uniref:Uncharacterized protein n=1 Tax=Granulibacter bethesdensis (strain ATCC BAA-1260 / CGDNIH1) TaxID=391165 RepID=Q0BSJ6_GRABC|nr:Hypothetical protein GbCGDNIH1_1308 [Granulibacter bethesdensis CGDNIH1]APG30660.1 Hypothetical protein GbCGDNIH2_1308 [Granulibacter bethesdensis]APH52033.1 Hypothetical protein GbCGDNIH5_1308 [Granulibacter bethesdensis]APH64723.1 Hypothetical protein GbCGDNIH1I4_1308 [Granulibacter bethesdensis]
MAEGDRRIKKWRGRWNPATPFFVDAGILFRRWPLSYLDTALEKASHQYDFKRKYFILI